MAKLANYKRNTSRATARQLKIQERQLLALELHTAGSSFSQISEHLKTKGYKGCSRSNVGKDVDAALEDANQDNIEKKKHIVQLELRRLDALTMSSWPRTMREGNPDDIHAQLAIMARRARYLNLEKPGKLEVTGKDGGPVETAIVRVIMPAGVSDQE